MTVTSAHSSQRETLPFLLLSRKSEVSPAPQCHPVLSKVRRASSKRTLNQRKAGVHRTEASILYTVSKDVFFSSARSVVAHIMSNDATGVKTLLAHKHHHLHHGHARSGCGLEAVLVGILLIVPLMVLIGLMLPIVLIIISVMVGTPLLVPAVPPALLPPLNTDASQGRRRRQVFGEPLEDVLVTTLEKLLVAVAKYGDL
ncbi:hypothetical protein HPB51_024434 [Rhipicephalus microplus]|uniref:Uncharacterized protein n=1 Tax=Rhipicephalus microplus TaxID=6941 RepID=A0A9J6D7J4_RHIMP|nr:hypothetical protein HPB51_024434 [Rhipicephalus microplus]